MSDLYDITKEETKLKKFVQNKHQEAVVYKLVTRMDKQFAYCYSPVWGDLMVQLGGLSSEEEDLRRGDIVVVTYALVNDETKERPIIIENKTQTQIKQNGADKILKDFNNIERQKIAFAAAKRQLTK